MGSGTGHGAAALLFERVTRSYARGFLGRKRPAISGLDLTVRAGEFVGLVGANGSGKSTLLRLAAGVEDPDRGRVQVFGRDASRPLARERVGFVPEGSPWPPELSVESALVFALALAGVGRRERRERARAAIARAGLEESARTPLGRCSSGQRRRFALAQAFARRPSLLLFDEPSVALDAEGARILGDWLEEARAGGAAAVIASHLPGDLLGRCERLVVLAHGEVVADGPMEELAARAGHVELDVELGAASVARVTERVAEAGARVVAARPSAAGLLHIERRRGGADA